MTSSTWRVDAAVTDAAVLLGRDHTTYGEIAVESVGTDVALALSIGARPKGYRHSDPNEDMVAAVAGRRATLLILADGHNGFEAPSEAVGYVLERWGDDPPPVDVEDAELVDLFHGAGEAILAVTHGPDCAHPESRTTLIVALLARPKIQWAAMGDSGLYLVSRRGARELGEPSPRRFVGYPMTREQAGERLARGTDHLAPEDWVVAVSDGVSDFIAGIVDRLIASVADDPEPTVVAERLVHAAFAGGAGDNLAVAVHAPTP